MITYRDFQGITVPVLHRVHFKSDNTRFHPWSWCKENCRAPFYLSPGWRTDSFVEFEDDEDATMFALRWS